MSDMNFDFDFGLDMDELLKDEGVEVVDSGSLKFNVIPVVITSRDAKIVETIYLTDNIDTAKVFNKELDDFSSSTYFVLPDGKEVRNETALAKFELKVEEELTEEEIIASSLAEFNNQYLRAMLEA